MCCEQGQNKALTFPKLHMNLLKYDDWNRDTQTMALLDRKTDS